MSVTVAALFASAVAHAASPKLYVNGATGSDTSACRIATHPCQTINYALTQSQDGDTIQVAKGTYPEQLDISKNVTIKGAAATGAAATIIEPSSLTFQNSDPNHPSTPQGAIVTFEPNVTSGNLSTIQVNGSAAPSQFTDCASNYSGVYYHDASGSVMGATVSGVQLPSTLNGCQDGLAVFVTSDDSSASPSNVTMSHVTVNTYQKNGITCKDVGTICTISGSMVTGGGPTGAIAQNGIEVFGADASITTTTVQKNSYTSPSFISPGDSYTTAAGILAINAGNLTIDHSTAKLNDDNIYAMWYPAFGHVPSAQGTWNITNNVASQGTNNTGTAGGSSKVPVGYGVGDGIVLDGAGLSGGTTTVTGNTANTGADSGILLLGTVNATVGSNVTNSSKNNGIYVGDNPNIAANTGTVSSGNTLSNNTSNLNVHDGILADTTDQESNNTFTGNILQTNRHFDAQDLSSGLGTGGTANTWSGNQCKPAADGSPEATCTN